MSTLDEEKWLQSQAESKEEAYILGDDPSSNSYALGDGDSSINDEVTDENVDDPELEAIKARVKEMEEEAKKLKEMQKEAEESLKSPTHSGGALGTEDKGEVDARSVYVGNVDYSATAAELEQHFHGCGSVNRVTILCDKFSGHPKGFAYVEFTDKDSIDNACQLNDSLFKGRQIKVSPKRTNVPGISSTNRGFRGGGRARGRGRGFSSYGGFGSYGGYSGYSPYTPRGRGRGAFRSRRAQWFSPY